MVIIMDYGWFVVWNMNFICPYIFSIVIPTDVHIFQRGMYTTNQISPDFSIKVGISRTEIGIQLDPKFRRIESPETQDFMGKLMILPARKLPDFMEKKCGEIYMD